jgi:hypothetical protein
LGEKGVAAEFSRELSREGDVCDARGTGRGRRMLGRDGCGT